MFAKSEKTTGVGMAHIPLQSRQTPPLATIEVTAMATIKQFQPIAIDMETSTARPVTTLSGGVQMPAPHLAIAAYPAVNGEKISVYVQGYFNVNALDMSAISGMASANAETKAKALNRATQSGLYFDAFVDTDPVTSV